jgi:hypothetical protein
MVVATNSFALMNLRPEMCGFFIKGLDGRSDQLAANAFTRQNRDAAA